MSARLLNTTAPAAKTKAKKAEPAPVTVTALHQASIDRLEDKYTRVSELASTPEVQQFIAAIVELNALADSVKAGLKQNPPEEGAAGFEYKGVQTKQGAKKTVYDPAKLPPEVLRRPGVVSSIDAKLLEGLVTGGELAKHAAVIATARSEQQADPTVVMPFKVTTEGELRKLLTNT